MKILPSKAPLFCPILKAASKILLIMKSAVGILATVSELLNKQKSTFDLAFFRLKESF